MALTSAGQIRKQIERLRKDLNAAARRAEKQRKLAQDSLGSLLSRARNTLSSLGSSRIAKLLGSAGKKSAPAKRAAKKVAKKAVSRAKKAAKSAQRSVNRATRQATRTAKKVRSQAKKVQTQARRRVKTAQKAVKKVQKRVQASLPQLPLSGGMSRAAMATSRAKASTPPPAPPAVEAAVAQSALPL